MARPVRKKNDIERAALELFVEKGVDGTSIRDIAERSGVTEGALYRHHRSKDDLVRALFLQSFMGYAEMMEKALRRNLPFSETIAILVHSFYALYDEDRYVFEFVMIVRHRLLDEVRADEGNPVELLSRMLTTSRQRGELPEQDLALTTQLVLGLVLQVPVAARYGRIPAPLVRHAPAVTAACLRVCGV